nr:MAG TPA: hypothetical protein [Caudoviricetes sp.]
MKERNQVPEKAQSAFPLIWSVCVSAWRQK